MLEKHELEAIFDRLGTPQAGRELVRKARIMGPSREVKSRGGNVITLISSRKMQHEIRTESRHIEYAAAIMKEFDSNVLEYYAQPSLLKLDLFDDCGELHRISHYPDFLEIREDGFYLEEWKSEEKLQRLSEKQPYRYVKSNDGLWLSPQIEKQLADIGIRYRIHSGNEINRRRLNNYQHLAEYFDPTAEPCPETTVERLRSALAEHGALTIFELREAPFNFSSDELFKAIADHLVVTDLDRDDLTDSRNCKIYRDHTLREFIAAQVRTSKAPAQDRFVIDIHPGASFRYESQNLTIALIGAKSVTVTSDDGKSFELETQWLTEAISSGQAVSTSPDQSGRLDLTRYSEAQLRVALKRNAILQSDRREKLISDRTVRRWSRSKKIAQSMGGNEVIALIPKHTERGNRTPRLSDLQASLMRSVFNEHWVNNKATNYSACHRFLESACLLEDVKPPSLPTLIDFIKKNQTDKSVRSRYGKRITYQQSQWVDVLYADTPTHGSRPFQSVHIDHTQIDIEVISRKTGAPLGRPWLSIAIDAYTRRVVGLYLTFDPPSYVSVMMVVRDMVRRFERLPEMIVTDNGRDFMSTAFEHFLMLMGVHLRFRPAGQPRHGAVLERIFGSLHSQYIHNLAGNTKLTKNVRTLTGTHLPAKLAQWTLQDLFYGIQHWATEYYDEEVHPALHESPRQAFQRGIYECGSRAHKKILMNEDFLIATCPPVDREGSRVVNPQSGVKVNEQHYWHTDFRSHQFSGKKCLVRLDPWDASSVYVWLKDRWVQARCRNLMGLGQLTEFERIALTKEFEIKFGSVSNDSRRPQRLHEYLKTFTPSGALAIAFEREAENKSLYNELNLSSVVPHETLHRLFLTDPIRPIEAINHLSDTSETLPTSEKTSASTPDDIQKFDRF